MYRSSETLFLIQACRNRSFVHQVCKDLDKTSYLLFSLFISARFTLNRIDFGTAEQKFSTVAQPPPPSPH
jgi:hypothetical protein